MEQSKKKRGVDPMEQWLIFAVLTSTRAINLNGVLTYELAAVPTYIFVEKSGELGMSTSKSILERKHHVEVTNPSIGIRDAEVISGCAILCVLQWPSKGFIKDTILHFVKYAPIR